MRSPLVLPGGMKLMAARSMIVIGMALAASAQGQGAATTKKVVQDVQQQLRILGYDPGPADGEMGTRTLAALRKFQSDHGLPATGVLDQKTLDALRVTSVPARDTDVHAKGNKGKTPSHAVVSEDEEWNRALLLNSITAYMSFYKDFPDTRRLGVLQGTLEAVIGGQWTGEHFQNSVSVKMNGSDLSTMSLQEALKWDLVLVESVGGGFSVRQRPPIPNAKIIMLKEPDRIACIDTNGGIHEAARNGDLGKVQTLLEDDPALVFNGKGKYGGTPLHSAALAGHKDVAELLLASKAEVNANDNDGQTPLHYAATNGYKAVVELLLANKAKVDVKDNHGRQPLYWAAFKGRKDVAELLLANGADVNAKDNDGYTPLHAATLGVHEDVAKLLRQHGGHE